MSEILNMSEILHNLKSSGLLTDNKVGEKATMNTAVENKRLRVISESEANKLFVCVFCKKYSVNELKYGPMYLHEGVVTHYFCMLFSAALSQQGKDNEGILGFLPQDIMKEVRRSLRLKCSHCEEIGASIGCCNKRCRQAFHFPCGLKHGANFQFFGNFESYCHDHAVVQQISLRKKEWQCPVCMGSVTASERPIQATCCRAAVFHKECMQKVALNAGYFFKCPTCNASKNFVQEMRTLGIFVPEQDASWEREPNAYHDLLYQYSKCDAEKCECSKGREYGAAKGNWLLARCRICGAAGVHRQCGNLKTVDNWACETCVEVERKTDLEKEKAKKKKALQDILKKKKALEERARLKKEKKAYIKNLSSWSASSSSCHYDDFKMSDLVISDTCFNYFPYENNDLYKFNRSATLPDWRNLQLTVNLTDWIQLVKVGGPKVSSLQRTENPNEDRRTSKGRKRSIWQRGIVKKHKSSAKKVKSEDSEATSCTTLNDCTTDSNTNTTTTDNNTNNTTTDNNANTIIPMDDEPPKSLVVDTEEKAQRKCQIFPFVANFLKSGLVLHDRRKQDNVTDCAKKNLQSEPIPPLQEQVLNTNVDESCKPDSISLTSVDPNLCQSDLTSTKNQLLVWKAEDGGISHPSKVEIRKELEDLFPNTQSPADALTLYLPTSQRFPDMSTQPPLPTLSNSDSGDIVNGISQKHIPMVPNLSHVTTPTKHLYLQSEQKTPLKTP